jgi:hypothetical protein
MRAIAAVLALHTGALSVGLLQFADADCADADHAALSTEHAALSHQHPSREHLSHEHVSDERGDHRAGGERLAAMGMGHGDEAPAADSSHGDDRCPPFCGDCHDCGGCFHPIAVVARGVSAPPRPTVDRSVTHPELVPHAPPAWGPPAPLHVPILA